MITMHQPERARSIAPVVIGAAVAFTTTTAMAAPMAMTNTVITSPAQSNPAYQRAIAWGILKARLIRWSTLEEDWDGNDGAAPSDRVIANAKEFIAKAMKIGSPIPAPYISGDGEIGYRWGKNYGFASVSFVDDHIIALVRDPEGVADPLRLDAIFDADDVEVGNLLTALAAYA